MDIAIIDLTGFASQVRTRLRGLTESRGFARLAFADLLKKVAYDIDPHVETTPGCFERFSILVDRIGMDRAKSYDDVRRLLQPGWVGTARLQDQQRLW